MRPVGLSASLTTKQIVFCGLINDRTWQVSTLEPNGIEGSTRWTYTDSDKMHPFLSILGEQIFATTNSGELIVVDLASRREKVLDIGVKGMTDAAWSTDGQKVLFSLSIANSIDANDIWLVNLENRKRRRLTNMKHMQHDPAWTADEKQVVFVSGAGGQNHDLFILDLESGAVRQLTAGQRYHFEPACSVNNEIAFSSNRTGDYEIWVCDLEGKRFEQITHSPGLDGQPTWSPDGKKIAFVSARSGYPAIWVINRDGSNGHQISPEGMRCREPAWSR
jgi:TolB protein